MNKPSKEHVEAVATILDATPPWSEAGELAHVILTATDPAVLDAMQDALVRAGRLTEQVMRRRCSCGVANTFAHVMSDGHHALPDQIRFVTEWREVTP